MLLNLIMYKMYKTLNIYYRCNNRSYLAIQKLYKNLSNLEYNQECQFTYAVYVIKSSGAVKVTS